AARTRATWRTLLVAGHPIDRGTAIAPRERTELDRGPQRLADRGAQFVEVGAVLLGAEHRIQPLLGPAERPLGAATDLPHDRVHELGQVGLHRDGDERDIGAPGMSVTVTV